MIRFNNDYNRGALESILDGLTEINAASYAGYGEDQWCGRAEAVIKKLIAREDAMIKFVPGATQANIVAIAAALSTHTAALTAMHGSCLPRISISLSVIVSRSTVRCLSAIDGVGLNAVLNTIGIPVEIPPRIPPFEFVRVFTVPSSAM